MTTARPERARHRPWSRIASLLLAVPLALVLLIHPALMLDARGGYSHGLLMLVMLGVSGGFVHGVGFDPRARLWALLFGPTVAWPLMLLGYTLLLRARMA
ncbi:TPA: cyd operon YbgE family protein [Pseudomonas aeruginosa]